MFKFKSVFALLACLLISQSAQAQERMASLSLNLSPSGKHTMLQQVIETSGMAGMLNNSSGFTIFAPTDSAFTRLSKTTLNALLDPDNSSGLKAVMANHVVRGSLNLEEIKLAVEKGGGEAAFPTISGEQLVFRATEKGLTLTDWRGHTARISSSDFQEGRNTVHAIDRILL